MFLSSKVHTNKLALHSELIIFIGYKNNGYCFIQYIQGNIIFHSTHAIFDKKFFSKCTDSYAKECKLYDKLLDKISLEIKLSVPGSSVKYRSALVSISHILILPIQNNPCTYFLLLFLSYKSLFSFIS